MFHNYYVVTFHHHRHISWKASTAGQRSSSNFSKQIGPAPFASLAITDLTQVFGLRFISLETY